MPNDNLEILARVDPLADAIEQEIKSHGGKPGSGDDNGSSGNDSRANGGGGSGGVQGLSNGSLQGEFHSDDRRALLTVKGATSRT